MILIEIDHNGAYLCDYEYSDHLFHQSIDHSVHFKAQKDSLTKQHWKSCFVLIFTTFGVFKLARLQCRNNYFINRPDI